MKRLVFAAFVGACALACSGGRTNEKPALNPFDDFAAIAPKVGEQAPAFELRDLDGATVRLSDATARGPVVIVFGSFS
ncbi:MAG TPA: hypothetical protein VL463_30760 [Kofleriaceae bacterium]|nr:hypothetical protein [Kofleriaceae bacterium]